MINMPEELLKPSLISQRFRGFLPVVVDVETGGFDARNNALLEVAAVILEMDRMGKLQIKESYTRTYNLLKVQSLSNQRLNSLVLISMTASAKRRKKAKQYERFLGPYVEKFLKLAVLEPLWLPTTLILI